MGANVIVKLLFACVIKMVDHVTFVIAQGNAAVFGNGLTQFVPRDHLHVIQRAARAQGGGEGKAGIRGDLVHDGVRIIHPVRRYDHTVLVCKSGGSIGDDIILSFLAAFVDGERQRRASRYVRKLHAYDGDGGGALRFNGHFYLSDRLQIHNAVHAVTHDLKLRKCCDKLFPARKVILKLVRPDLIRAFHDAEEHLCARIRADHGEFHAQLVKADGAPFFQLYRTEILSVICLLDLGSRFPVDRYDATSHL